MSKAEGVYTNIAVKYGPWLTAYRAERRHRNPDQEQGQPEIVPVEEPES